MSPPPIARRVVPLVHRPKAPDASVEQLQRVLGTISVTHAVLTTSFLADDKSETDCEPVGSERASH